MATEIGIGPSLFLLTTRSLIYLFLILTLLNLPVMYFYYHGNVVTEENGQKENSIFIKFSLGNL